MKKKPMTKDSFFNELERELIKYYSLSDTKEIIEDYKIFYNEKESMEQDDETIIRELGDPHLIVQELLNDKMRQTCVYEKICNMKKTRVFIGVVWLVVTLLFFWLLQGRYLISSTEIGLTIIQIALFWYTFCYKRMLIRKKEIINPKKMKVYFFCTVGAILMTYLNLIVLGLFSYSKFQIPILDRIPVNMIGPIIHYQMLVAIVMCFIVLYKILLKYNNIGIHLNSIFLLLSSIIILIRLHSKLGILSSMEIFNAYLKSQIVTYSVIVFLYGILYIISLKNPKEGIA